MKRAIAGVALILIATTAFAGGNDGEPEIVTDEDALFGDGGDLFAPQDDLFGGELIATTEQTATRIDEALLVSESVEIGGRYTFTVETAAIWNDAFAAGPRYREPDDIGFATHLSSRLFLDARPGRDFRVFGQATLSYPFATDGTRTLEDVFAVEELFSDFTWNNAVFVRAGKQTLNWGVGTFYSPGNLLRDVSRAPVDPDSRQTGRLAVRASIPIRTSSTDAYLLLPAFTDSSPRDTGIAARGEFLAGKGEIAIGARLQRDTSPAAKVAVTRSIGGFDLFGEGVMRYGSDRVFLEEIAEAPGLAAGAVDDELFFSTMVGLRYAYTPVGADWGVSAIAEYYYNGEGYDDPSVVTGNPAAVGALLGANELSPEDLAATGKHYSAVSAEVTGLFGTTLDAGIIWLHNYTDRSALIVPSVSLTLLNHLTATVRTPVNLGDENGEFSPLGNRLSVSLSASIGSGSF